MTTYVVNSKVCEGVKFDKTNLSAGTAYPTNLVKDSQASKWLKPDGGLKDITDAQKKTTEAAIASCRYWYDEQKHGKSFCCQMMEAGTVDADKKYTLTQVGASAVIDGTSTSAAEVVDMTAESRYIPGAETFNGAMKAAATAATVIAAAVAMY